jgi:hypothetical protein
MKDIANIIGARIAGRPTYSPAYTVAGVEKPRSAKVEFNVFKNKGEKKLVFRITAWGGMADAIARGGAVGKKITFSAEIIPFEGRVWMPMPDGSHQFVTKPDGTPLTNWKTGYTIMDMEWGRDSAKTIANEIAGGLRPVGWDNAASPDRQMWLQTCANRNVTKFQIGAQTFEYANVDIKNLPQGAQIIQNTVANNVAQNQPITQQFVQPAMQQPQTQQYPQPGHGNPSNIMPKTKPQNVMVNGQNMGYVMPGAQQQPQQMVANPIAVQQGMPTLQTGFAQPTQPVQQDMQTGYVQPMQQASTVIM